MDAKAKSQFQPFSTGPKDCIGRRTAPVAFKVMIATMLARGKIDSFESKDYRVPMPLFRLYR